MAACQKQGGLRADGGTVEERNGENMRAYQLPKSGAGIEALAKVERPDPSKPGHRQVLVKVRACSLNFRDLGIVRGSYRMPVRENVIPLSDGAGEVVEVGAGVTRVKAGDRVAGNFFQRWPGGDPAPDVHTSALGGGTDGMLAEYAMLEEDGVVKIPSHLSLEEGATLPCAGVTVWNAMMEHARLKAGDTVLLQGTGGVSIFGLQFARAHGHFGDHHLVERRKAQACKDPRRRPRHQLQDHARLGESRGGIYRRPRRRSRGRGRRRGDAVALVPRHSRRRQDHDDRRPERWSHRTESGLIFGRRANVQGISVGSTQMFIAMNRAIEVSAIKPVIDKVFSFADAQAAYQHMASGAHFGKIVIRVRVRSAR